MTTLPAHQLYAELRLSAESGRNFVQRAQSQGLPDRRVRIGGPGGSSSWLELRVPVEQLSVLADSRRRARAAATQSPSPKDPRCKATCAYSHRKNGQRTRFLVLTKEIGGRVNGFTLYMVEVNRCDSLKDSYLRFTC